MQRSYEAWVIYNFTALCLAYVGGPGAVVVKAEGKIVKPSWIMGTCCLPPLPVDGPYIRSVCLPPPPRPAPLLCRALPPSSSQRFRAQPSSPRLGLAPPAPAAHPRNPLPPAKP